MNTGKKSFFDKHKAAVALGYTDDEILVFEGMRSMSYVCDNDELRIEYQIYCLQMDYVETMCSIIKIVMLNRFI